MDYNRYTNEHTNYIWWYSCTFTNFHFGSRLVYELEVWDMFLLYLLFYLTINLKIRVSQRFLHFWWLCKLFKMSMCFRETKHCYNKLNLNQMKLNLSIRFYRVEFQVSGVEYKVLISNWWTLISQSCIKLKREAKNELQFKVSNSKLFFCSLLQIMT